MWLLTLMSLCKCIENGVYVYVGLTGCHVHLCSLLRNAPSPDSRIVLISAATHRSSTAPHKCSITYLPERTTFLNI